MTSKSKVVKSKVQASQSIIGAGLSKAATSILVSNLSAKTIAGGAGADPNELPEEVTLFAVVLDETGSMQGNRPAVIQAFDEMVKALKDSKAADSILMSVWAFNDRMTRLVHSYLPLELAPSLTDYDPDNGTNLFDATLDAITGLLQYEDDLKNAGTRTQSIVVAFTDGEDNASRNPASAVKTVVDGLIAKEKYVFSLVAFGQGYANATASEMGFPNILELGSSPTDIRHAMGTVSKSVIRASQTKIVGKSQSGFFNP